MKEIDAPTVLLIRHGKTAFNKDGGQDRLKGTKYDLPLTAEGKDEARVDAKTLSDYPIASLRHSPLKRSAQTAEIISRATGVASTEEKGLHPWDVGYLSGQKRDAFRGLIEWFIKHPDRRIRDGESYRDFFDTFGGALSRELARAASDPSKARVLVSHSCGLLAAEAIVNGSEPKPHTGKDMAVPGRIMRITKTNGKWRIGWLDS